MGSRIICARESSELQTRTVKCVMGVSACWLKSVTLTLGTICSGLGGPSLGSKAFISQNFSGESFWWDQRMNHGSGEYGGNGVGVGLMQYQRGFSVF